MTIILKRETKFKTPKAINYIRFENDDGAVDVADLSLGELEQVAKAIYDDFLDNASKRRNTKSKK